MNAAPIPWIPEFQIQVSTAWVRLKDIQEECPENAATEVESSPLYIGEKVYICESMNGVRCLNETVIKSLTEGVDSQAWLEAFWFEPKDLYEEKIVEFAVSYLAANRLSRTSAPFGIAPRKNSDESSNKGVGRSPAVKANHYELALQHICDSDMLREGLATRLFGVDKDEIKPRHLEVLLSYQVSRKSVQLFLNRSATDAFCGQ